MPQEYDYKVVWGEYTPELEREVRALVAEGYRCLGGVTTGPSGLYYQALERSLVYSKPKGK